MSGRVRPVGGSRGSLRRVAWGDQRMNGDVVLSICLLGQSEGRYQFALTVRNESATRLLIPWPQIPGFRFRAVGRPEEAEWFTSTLESSSWRGVVLKLGKAREFVFSVVACGARR